MSSGDASVSRSALSGNALDEYKHLGEDLRHYGILRLARLTLLLGTTGAMVTALATETVRAHSTLFALLKVGSRDRVGIRDHGLSLGSALAAPAAAL